MTYMTLSKIKEKTKSTFQVLLKTKSAEKKYMYTGNQKILVGMSSTFFFYLSYVL